MVPERRISLPNLVSLSVSIIVFRVLSIVQFNLPDKMTFFQERIHKVSENHELWTTLAYGLLSS